ncbi:MAG: hypothetical protein GY773_08150, partial [Actinomycetia bacterium]|nr:hypothetical protein [Actinomycetes bacterium]
MQIEPSPTSTNLEQRLRMVGGDLSEAMRSLLDTFEGTPHRPNDLASLLGVNRAVTSKLLAAVAKPDPMEVLHLIPGPEPLRKVLAGVDPTSHGAVAAAARSAINAFADLIEQDAGTRPALE